jgi:hypothetical protein
MGGTMAVDPDAGVAHFALDFCTTQAVTALGVSRLCEILHFCKEVAIGLVSPLALGGVGAAAGWPLIVQAQQHDRLRRLGVLMGSENNASRGTPAACSLM